MILRLLWRIVQPVYSAYALGLFFVTMIPALTFYLLLAPLPGTVRMRIIYVYNRIWLFTWGICCGIPILVRNNEKRNPKENYVFLSNHCNILDIILCGSCIQHPFQPLIKKELLRVPLLGQLLLLTSIPVDRSSAESRKESLKVMTAKMQRGMSILIFPEGTRNRTDQPLKDFYDGGFRLAIAAQTPILPIVLLDLRERQPVGSLLFSPGVVSLNYLDPVPTAGLTESDTDALKEKVREIMYRFIVENDRSFRHLSATSAR